MPQILGTMEVVNNMPQYTTKKCNLIFISGIMGSGKTECAKYLASKLNMEFGGGLFRAVIYPLAEPIKTLAREWFGWDGRKDEKGRRLLQVIGTDAGRAYNENLWAGYLLNRIEGTIFPPNFVFVDDWRFQNEVQFFKDYPLFDITTIRIVRNVFNVNDVNLNHESEHSLPEGGEESLLYGDGVYNFTIHNNSTLEDFYKKLDTVYAYLSGKVFDNFS